MSASADVLAGRIPMSWQEYWELDESVRGEYLDGYLVVTPPPDRQHQWVVRRLANLIESSVPSSHRVATEAAWTPQVGSSFVPDVMVYDAAADDGSLVSFTGTPALVIEVLSQNRSDDLVVKMAKYASFGLDHYWIIDRANAKLEVFVLENGGYRQLSDFAGDKPVTLDFGIATVTLSVATLLAY